MDHKDEVKRGTNSRVTWTEWRKREKCCTCESKQWFTSQDFLPSPHSRSSFHPTMCSSLLLSHLFPLPLSSWTFLIRVDHSFPRSILLPFRSFLIPLKLKPVIIFAPWPASWSGVGKVQAQQVQVRTRICIGIGQGWNHTEKWTSSEGILSMEDLFQPKHDSE